jgi:long-chain acyl-CoA synthetase
MIRHRNYYEMTAVFDSVPGLLQLEDTIFLYLPLAHTFGRLLHLVSAYAGYTLAFCRDPLRIAKALPVVRPTIFPSVPRVYEQVHTGVLSQLESAHGVRKRLGDWALNVGREASARRQEGRPLTPWLALRHRLADRLLFSKVKQRFGGRLRLAISGGAPISVDVLRFFHALDILICEGYGLTECTTACAVNLPDRYRFGTVGPLLPGFEARIAEDGELLLRSDTVFAGYYRNEEATREAIDPEGWLHTGDIARIDEDGFLAITDRKKDILITDGGKNVAPQNLENELKASKYISQALVVGDRRPYIAALITLNQAEVDKSGSADVEGLIRSVVNDVNRNHSRFEQIRRFEILPRDFSAEEGEITPTLKLKRRVVQEHFAADIERLYD